MGLCVRLLHSEKYLLSVVMLTSYHVLGRDMGYETKYKKKAECNTDYVI